MGSAKWGGEISPGNDIIDTREVIDRIEEIESEYMDDEGEERPRDTWTPSDRAEWEALQEIIYAVGEVAARHGVPLIRETYFTKHIMEEYREIGPELHEFDRNTHQYRHVPLDELYSRFPFMHVDWKAVAEDVRSGYSIYEFDGVTYYYDGQ